MITQLPETHNEVLGFEISGKITIEQEKEWIEKISKAAAEHGPLSVMLVLNEDAGWGIKAGLADIKWIMSHLSSINKIAIVSSSRVWKWLVTVDAVFASWVGVKERHFETAKKADAWLWVNQELE